MGLRMEARALHILNTTLCKHHLTHVSGFLECSGVESELHPSPTTSFLIAKRRAIFSVRKESPAAEMALINASILY
jgi:hypothetical protein